jgi:hypothetical protein
MSSHRDLETPRAAPAAAPRHQRLLDRVAIVAAFRASPEHDALAPADRDPSWVLHLLDGLDGWDSLDRAYLTATMFDGFPWLIDAPPEDPGRIARVLEAFVRFAGRVYRAPHAGACGDYLRGPRAADEIRAWVAPIERGPLVELSAPFNWCDRRCERCPLADGCPLNRATPGPADRWAEDHCLEGVQRAALATADAASPRDGQDPERVDRSEASLAGVRLRTVGLDYGIAVGALVDDLAAAGGWSDEELVDLRTCASVVAARCARIAVHLTCDGRLAGDTATIDGVPNLLLVDHLVTDVDRRLPTVGLPRSARPYLRARRSLRRLLEPLLAAAPAEPGEEIELLAIAGRAPSPFCKVARPPPPSRPAG